MIPFRTVLFDLDGTLLNTLGDLTDSVNHVLQAYGYPLRREEEIRRFLGNGSRNLIARSLPEGVDPQTAEKVHADYLAWYGPHSQIRTGPYEGIPELLDRLQEQGIQMAVISNKGDGQVKPLTEKYFPQIGLALGERVGIPKKPNPESVFEALRQLGADPSTAIYVGDSEVDVETAKNAGIPSVAVGWGFRDRDELLECKPDRFIEHPLDLLK